jgi:TetR/AcrR family transcriptional regulator
MPSQPEPRTRDAERSKNAILEAATQLFAQKGFDATGIGEIAQLAGVARGTPAYFFGSKEALFEEVVSRLNQRAVVIVPTALERAGENPNSDRLIEVFIDTYLEFHAANPEFLRVIHWISLTENRLTTQAVTHWNSLASMLSAVMMTLKDTPLEHTDPRQMVLTIIGMCNAHLTYGVTVAEPLGLHTTAPDFLETRKTHLKRILIAALRGSSP